MNLIQSQTVINFIKLGVAHHFNRDMNITNAKSWQICISARTSRSIGVEKLLENRPEGLL